MATLTAVPLARVGAMARVFSRKLSAELAVGTQITFAWLRINEM